MNPLFIIAFLCFGCAMSLAQVPDTVPPTKSTSILYGPSISLENPVGGGEFGQVAIGFSYQNKTRISNNDDGSVAVYVGLGDPYKYIGGGLTINIFGLTNNLGEKNNIFEGGLDLHLNKFLINKKLLVDVGLYNPVVWGGNSYITYQKSWYFSANYFLTLKGKSSSAPFSYVSFTGGFGNGNFRTEDTYTEFKSGEFEPFGSIATPLFKNTNIILEWNGYDFGGGISTIPLQKIPLMFTWEVTDLSYGNPRMVASVSLPLNFKKNSTSRNTQGSRPTNIKSIRPVRTIPVVM